MPYTNERLRSRHPFELLFLYVAAAAGISGLAAPDFRPGSIQEGVGHLGTLAWYIAILVGSVGALVGIFWRERATGLILEATGLAIVGAATIFYGVSAVILLGGVAVYPALTVMAYGVAAIWRAAQIRNRLVTVARELSSVSEG